jgi:stage V sporulation protein G
MDDAMQTTITVRHLRPLQGRTVYALLDADIEIGGVVISIVGVQARHLQGGGTSVHLPTFRDADGKWRAAVILPDEICDALSDAVLAFMVEEGVATQAGSGQPDAEADDFGAKLAARRGSIPADVDLGI